KICTSFTKKERNKYGKRYNFANQPKNLSGAAFHVIFLKVWIQPANPVVERANNEVAADVHNTYLLPQKVAANIADLRNTADNLKIASENLEAHLTAAEQRISDAEGEAWNKAARIKSLEVKMAVMADKTDNLENRSRCNNLRILGFPEGVKEGNPTAFLTSVLPALLFLPSDISLCIRAHRSLGPHPVPKQRPRAFIIKVLMYPMRECLLRAAWEQGTLEWKGNKISLFPDLSKELQTQRQRFNPARKILQEKGVKYGVFYPATMKITINGVTSTFSDSVEAQKFAAGLPAWDSCPPSST
uniref:L1 transposable element RRM domain-containing protein n=1 Tax=Latimeria chalumnae TaxID=7897 RepID=H3AI23_LATCH